MVLVQEFVEPEVFVHNTVEAFAAGRIAVVVAGRVVVGAGQEAEWDPGAGRGEHIDLLVVADMEVGRGETGVVVEVVAEEEIDRMVIVEKECYLGPYLLSFFPSFSSLPQHPQQLSRQKCRCNR